METKDIALRQLTKEDVPMINTLRNDWQNKKLSLGVRYPITMQNDMDWYEKMSTDRTNSNVVCNIKRKKYEVYNYDKSRIGQ